ncbi:TolC family protein [Hyphococcus sp.]|jgi:outer membrane protein TolC|uniref:TolC family protein n=1 Tax=Hyphococcus sp. TaxID=2038636 RepID=UPI003D11A737
MAGAKFKRMLSGAVDCRQGKTSLVALVLVFIAGAIPAASAEGLTIDGAVALALGANDPTVARFTERASALDDRAVADSQLPDPQLRVGLQNFPVDTFDFEQEPMTQVQVGVRQSFPRGKTLSKTRERREAEAVGQREAASLQELQLVLDTRTAWLDLYYWLGARETVRESRTVVNELVEVVQTSFAAGVQSNQDLLRAELELSLLDDRAVEVERQIDARLADLTRLIGSEYARQPIEETFPSLPAPPERQEIEDGLVSHPAAKVEDAMVKVRDSDVEIAKQQYKPGWSLDAGYGLRGADRADFASAMVVLDIPIFTGKRQDRRLSAAKKERAAASFDRLATLLELKKALDRTYADWERLDARVGLFERVVLDRASANANAALDGYQNQVTDFAELIRSRLAELDTELQLRRLRVDHAKAQSQLLYLAGERS